MARQVQEMFPHYPLSVIISDLQMSRSIELTIHNILEGRLQLPARIQELVGVDDFPDTSNNSAVTTTTSTTTISTSSLTSSPSSSSSSTFSPTLNTFASTSSHIGGNVASTSFIANSANEYYASPDFSHHHDSSNTTSSGSVDSGYEIERNSNIFGNQNDLLRDDR